MRKISTIFAVYFLLVGCTSKVIITPDKLPDAVVDKSYYAEIKISGGSGPISGGGFDLRIYPDNSGLEVIFPEINGRADYNNIAIQGVPIIVGNITITIKGDMIPTGWNASSEFDKDYVIKVKEAE